MQFNYITSGELESGQYVTVLDVKPKEQEVLTFTGEVQKIEKKEHNYWLKGLPYEILQVRLPLIMVKNICKVPNMPPVFFFDTRIVNFLEVDKEYINSYITETFPHERTVTQSKSQTKAQKSLRTNRRRNESVRG